jgi:putative ATPase
MPPGAWPVPVRLSNVPTQMMKSMGDGYRYAHDKPDAFEAGERYLPE